MSYEIKIESIEDDWGEFGTNLSILIDGEVSSTYTDNGEPEDQTFGRDWSWVSGELKAAYALGCKHAMREYLDEMTRTRANNG